MLQFTLRFRFHFHFHLPLPLPFILPSILTAFCKSFALPARTLFTLSRTTVATAAATTTITLRNSTQLDCHGNFRFRRRRRRCYRLFGSQR